MSLMNPRCNHQKMKQAVVKGHIEKHTWHKEYCTIERHHPLTKKVDSCGCWVLCLTRHKNVICQLYMFTMSPALKRQTSESSDLHEGDEVQEVKMSSTTLKI